MKGVAPRRPSRVRHLRKGGKMTSAPHSPLHMCPRPEARAAGLPLGIQAKSSRETVKRRDPKCSSHRRKKCFSFLFIASISDDGCEPDLPW